MANREIIERVKQELGCWIEEGTAKKGWYTCQITGRKLRGQEAQEQLQRQREAIARAEVEQEHELALEQQKLAQEEVAVTAEVSKREAVDVATDEVVRQIGIPSNMKEIGNKMTARLRSHLLQRGGVDLVSIRCIDCGAERLIKPQDAFQVKRCVDCQHTYRKAKRAAARRAKRAAQRRQGQ